MATIEAVVWSLLLVQSVCSIETFQLQPIEASVKYNIEDDTYSFVLGIDKTAPAYGTYVANQMTTGWDELNVIAGSTKADDHITAKAAGYLEGALTHRQIYSFYLNLRSAFFKNLGSEDLKKVENYFSEQSKWMGEMIQKNSSTYWYYVGLINDQFEGLKMGYRDRAPQSHMLEDWEFAYIAANGDYFDMENFIFNRSIVDYKDMSKNQLLEQIYKRGHCSVLIKMLPGYENLYAAHSSWYMYEAMNRIYKHYSIKLHDDHAAMTVMSFSSFPGVLSSWDDFYIMDSKLMMLQTTNNIFDLSLYKHSTPQSLFSWHRVRIANWLASNGKEWSEYVSEYNSGTYNNQYMILDLKRIQLGHSIDDGALWVVEQIPGYMEYADQTAVLREGYWASYNIPFYETIFNKSGYPAVVTKSGPLASHDLAARAKIFRRDQGNVKDMATMKYLMRYNKYKTDEYSDDNSMEAICSRGDLAPKPYTGGCIDTKISDYHMALNLTSVAQSGPTYQDLFPFRWSTSPVANHSHIGQPDLFDFEYVTMSPTVV